VLERRSPDAGEVDAGTDAGSEQYEVLLFERARISSQGGMPNFHRVRAALSALRGGPFANVTLVTQLDTTCFPFTSWATNAPPAGHTWPADCDAFDRNYEWSLIDPSLDGGAPAIELLRAITPFGGPMRREVDVTDVFNTTSGPREVQVNIPTYSDGAGQVSGSNGGWFVSGKLVVTTGAPPRKVLAVTPLLYRSLGAADRTQAFSFTTPPGATRVVVEYRATGHGGPTSNDRGCFGPAEEFCTRRHTWRADGVELDSRRLLRTNCSDGCTLTASPTATGGTVMVCAENPCGSIASVRANRANWCPGSVTPPIVLWAPEWSTPGPHTLDLEIDRIATGGSWVVSATLFVYGD
jgi:hypothetical protein